MWTYIWAFLALLLGFCAFYLRNKYEDYRYEYSYSRKDVDNAVQENTKKLRAERAGIVKKLLSTLLNPHPENVVIYHWYDLSEIYHHPVDPRTPHYESYGTGCDVYGDGRVFISKYHDDIQQKIEYVGKPEDLNHLGKFIRENVDLYWFYLKVYRYFIESKQGDKHE